MSVVLSGFCTPVLYSHNKSCNGKKIKNLKISLLKILDNKMLMLTNVSGEHGQVCGQEAAQRPLHMIVPATADRNSDILADSGGKFIFHTGLNSTIA